LSHKFKQNSLPCFDLLIAHQKALSVDQRIGLFVYWVTDYSAAGASASSAASAFFAFGAVFFFGASSVAGASSATGASATGAGAASTALGSAFAFGAGAATSATGAVSKGNTDTYERLSAFFLKVTTPSASANKVWSRPIPTFKPGLCWVPR
jgi:hypothetical protein